MTEQEWIGVQFNLDRDMELKTWLEKYKSTGIKTDGEHITIKLGKNELKQLEKNKDDNMKLKLIKSAIRKCLKRSDYTNIYTYINSESVSKDKSDLLNNEFKKPIRITDFKDKNSILGNYENRLKSTQILKILRKDKLMIAMNEIFSFLISREFELEQKLTLELGYEDKEEIGADRDNINVSIQLEILEE